MIRLVACRQTLHARSIEGTLLLSSTILKFVTRCRLRRRRKNSPHGSPVSSHPPRPVSCSRAPLISRLALSVLLHHPFSDTDSSWHRSNLQSMLVHGSPTRLTETVSVRSLVGTAKVQQGSGRVSASMDGWWTRSCYAILVAAFHLRIWCCKSGSCSKMWTNLAFLLRQK
jgi:hypothetical protein